MYVLIIIKSCFSLAFSSFSATNIVFSLIPSLNAIKLLILQENKNIKKTYPFFASPAVTSSDDPASDSALIFAKLVAFCTASS